MWLFLGLAAPASACGGFFCNGSGTTGYSVVPVEQSGERILFRVNDDQTVTTFVEVAYDQVEDVDFAWIIPIPEAIDAESVSTTSADLFNALEIATAPRFTFQYAPADDYDYYGYGYGDPDEGRGCGCGGNGGDKSDTGSYGYSSVAPIQLSTEATVEVLSQSVVGPFAIEVITAENAENFVEWLDINGYDLPPSAVRPLQHYMDLGMAFLGVKLAPEQSSGPIDTLEFTYPSVMPMIPIILTAIASSEDLPIQTYILADAPYIPIGWSMTRDIAPETLPEPRIGSDYLERVALEIDQHGGQAFVLEYAKPTSELPPITSINEVLGTSTYLTRWRGDVSPWQMTLDPEFVPEVGMPDYDNDHLVVLDFSRGSTPARVRKSWVLLAPLAGIGWWRRRNRIRSAAA